MKYEVKVGKEFEIVEAKDNVVVVVVKTEGSSKERFTLGNVVAMAVVFAIVSLTVSAAYGAATGDYSSLKTISQYVKDILEVAIPHGGK